MYAFRKLVSVGRYRSFFIGSLYLNVKTGVVYGDCDERERVLIMDGGGLYLNDTIVSEQRAVMADLGEDLLGTGVSWDRELVATASPG